MGIYPQTRSYLMFCVCSVSVCGGSLVLKAKSVEFLYLSMDQSSFECAVQQCSLYLSVMGIGESWGYKAKQPHSNRKVLTQQAKVCREITNLQICTHQSGKAGVAHIWLLLFQETTQGSEIRASQFL